MQNKNRRTERERNLELQNPELVFSSAFPWSLYIGLGLGFSVVKTSQIYFKIKINIIYLYSDFKNIWRNN